MKLGIAADHGGYELKEQLIDELRKAGYELNDFGAYSMMPDDDYPDYVIPLARAVAKGEVDRGIAICGSGVGACIAANKVRGVRAALVQDTYSAHQGVEDDNMNVLCLGGRVIGFHLAWDLVLAYLNAEFAGKERYKRRLAEIEQLERQGI
jgi:ribose 5-phosphate isomerase B